MNSTSLGSQIIYPLNLFLIRNQLLRQSKRGAVTILSEHIQPVQTIISPRKEVLRVLLQQHGILDAVQRGTKIILLEGKNLSDLDQLVPAGKKIAIISINLLGGG